jgi:hypothetical protein
MVTIEEVLTPAPRPAWLALLAADRTAQITQTPAWLDCIQSAGPFRDTSRLYRFADGRSVLLPLAGRRYLPTRLGIDASWPFDWGIGGPIADGALRTEHVRSVYTDLAAMPALRVTVRSSPFAGPEWHAAPPPFRTTAHLTQIVDLSPGFPAVWARFRGNVRRYVHKAERSGLEIEAGNRPALVQAFQALYRQSVARWADQQHEPLALARWRAHRANPPAKFHTVADLLAERCAIWIARHAGEPAAAIIVLRHGQHAKYWRGAMNLELAGPTHANHLLHRLAIEDACQQGCRYYYMGDSRPGSGLARFKSGFGAQPYRTNTYRAERFPLTELDTRARSLAKRCLRFHDR